MTAAAIAQAATLLRQRTASAEATYEALLEKLANGGDEASEDIIAIAEAAGRTLDELQADVEKREGFAAARKQIEALPGVLDRIAAAEQKQRELSAELAAVQKRIGAQQESLSNELQAALATKARLEELQRRVTIGEFDLPTQAARRAQAGRTVAQHAPAAANLRTELEHELRKAAALQATLDQLKGRKQPDHNDIRATTAELTATRRRIEAIERDLRPIEQAIAAANQTFSQLSGGAA